MGLVAQLAGWRAGHRFTPGPLGGTVDPPLVATFPTTQLQFQVQLAFGADPSADPATYVWTDVTRYVFQGPKIVIKRGRDDEESQTAPSTCRLSLRNSDAAGDPTLDGLFTPRNASGPYFGYLRRNTPMRVDIDPGTGWVRRWTGFVANWPPETDVSGRFKAVRIEGAGILRQLGQGDAPIKSTMRAIVNYFSTTTAGLVYGYWPLEDGTAATQGASGLLDGTPAISVGVVEYAGETPAAGSAAAPSLASGGAIIGNCNSSATTDRWVVQFLFNCSAASTLLSWATTGTATGWNVSVTPSTIVVSTSAGAAVTVAAVPADGNWHIATVIGLQAGSDVSVLLVMDDNFSGSNVVLSKTTGRVVSVSANPLLAATVNSINHVVVQAASSTSINTNDMNGSPGDAAGGRFSNAATSAGIHTDVSAADIFDTELMGPQPVDGLLGVMRQAVDADEGVMVERRGGLLGFDSHAARENQAVGLTLNFTSAQIEPPFSPTEDDQLTRNDVTVRRTNGSSARSVDTTGPLGVTAVGRYDESVDRNLQADSQPIFHSSYLLTHGTVDETRFPQVNISLTRNPGLIASWLACDIGSRIQLTNLPSYLSVSTADQVLEGYTETLDPYDWTVELNLSPFSPHRVFRTTRTAGDADEFIGYMIPTTCVLAEDLDTTETDVDITSDTLWATGGLVLPGLTGSYASTPDIAALDVVGDIDLRVDMTPATWVDGFYKTPLSKWNQDTVNQRSWLLQITDAGTLRLVWSNDGTAVLLAVSTASITSPNGSRLAIRATLDVDNGAAGNTVTFYTSSTITGSWTQLGAAVTQAGVTSIFNSAAQAQVSGHSVALSAAADVAPYVVHAAEIRSGIGGSAVANPNFETQVAGTTGFTDSAGRVWALVGATAIAYDDWTPAVPVTVRGETMLVSRVSGGSNPQTLTVTRSSNGVVKTHPSGSTLEFATPGVLGL